MKKNIKNLCLVLFGLIVSFGIITNVEAAYTADLGGYRANGPSYSNASTMTKTSPKFNLSTIGVKLEGVSGDIEYYYHKDKSSGAPLFCLDSVLPSGNSLYARRFLFYDTDLIPLKDKNALKSKGYSYDVAVMAVLQSSTVNSNGSYFSTSLALRVVSALWGYLDTQSSGSKQLYGGKAQEVLAAIKTLAYQWANDGSSIGTDAYAISQILKTSSFANVWSSKYTFTGDPVTKAKDLVAIGVKAAREHLESVSDKTEIKVSNQKIIEKDTGVEGLVSKRAQYEITYANEENPAFIIDNIEIENLEKYGLLKDPYISSISVNGTYICNDAEAGTCDVFGKNILESEGILPLPEGGYKIVIEVSFDGYEKLPEGETGPLLNCSEMPLDYKINLSYNGGGSGSSASDFENYLGIIWYNRPSGNNQQRFISYNGEITPSTTPGEENKLDKYVIEDKIAVVEKCDCDILKDLCEKSGDISSEYCLQLTEFCEDCDILETFCKITKEEIPYCKEYYQKEECVDCEELEKACEESDNVDSESCQELKKWGENGICDDCFLLKAMCKLEGEGSEACIEYNKKVESGECPLDDCDDIAAACKRTDNINSDECKELKKFWEKDICKDCVVLEVLCKLEGEGSEACIEYNRKVATGECPTDNCDILKEACNNTHNPDSDECKEYQDKVNKGECPGDDPSNPDEIICGTEVIPITECCDADGNLIADPAFSPEQMMPDDYEIHGVKKEDIKACFVEAPANNKKPVDENKNKYELLSNDYCQVNCREDYAITFPTAKRVNAGRYFTFHVDMESHKQCFTSKINKEQYKKDVEAALKKIEEGFNGYQEWNQALKATLINDGKIPVDTSCGTSSSGVCGTKTTIEVDNGGHTESYTYQTYEFKYNYSKMDIASLNSDRKTTTKDKHAELGEISSCGSVISGGKTTSCGNVFPNPQGVTFDEFKSWLEDNAKHYKDMYEDGMRELYEKIIPKYKDCTDWEVEYKPKPDVKYTYDEKDYKTKAGMPIDMDVNSTTTDTKYEYCTESWGNDGKSIDVDSTYEKCYNGSNFGSDSKVTLNYVECNLEGGSCSTKNVELSETMFKKSNNDIESKYKPQSIFWNVYPSGNIITNGSEDNAVLLEELLPVSLNTRKGVHAYNILISQIGEFYATGAQGRFAGDDGILEKITGKKTIDYTCAYLVNIPTQAMKCTAIPCEGPDCITECVGDNCENENFDCDGVDCITECVGIGCIYNKDSGTSVLQKQVSLSSLFPNGTDSYNWLNEKGKATQEKIEASGNTIYDGTPILSLTITPSTSRAIREYNDKAEKDGGYSNNTITCQNIDGVGKQLACYSSFISDIIDGEYGSVLNEKSEIGKDITYRNKNNYFKFWTGTISEKDMMGPAYQ